MENTNKMSMTYELITPEMAKKILAMNKSNRTISLGTVSAYARDMVSGNWDENVGDVISIDENGILRNGQHRLSAVIKANVPVHMWICKGVSSNGIYDNNRKRNTKDQITIIRGDFESVYRSNRYISIAKTIIQHSLNSKARDVITAKEVIDFTEEHKKDLDGYFLVVPMENKPKLSVSCVHLAMFMAYMKNVKIGDIISFYDVLRSGMSTKPEEFPIISYRNYLLNSKRIDSTNAEIGRCQWALKKYLSKSCVKRTMEPNDLIYPFPWEKKSK